MKSENNLIRLGDTSFRKANQIKFYFNLILDINKFKQQSDNKWIIDLNVIYESYIDNKVFCYKNTGAISNESRICLLAKVFVNCGLLIKETGTIYKLTDTFHEINDFIEEKGLQEKSLILENKANLDIIQLVLLYLVIFKYKDINQYFIKWIKFLLSKNTSTINKFDVVLFEIINIENFDELSKKNYQDEKDFLTSLFSRNEFNNILNMYEWNCDKNELLKCFNERFKSIKLASFRKTITGFKEIFDIYNCFINDSLNQNVFEKISVNDEKVYKEFKKFIQWYYDISKNEQLNLNTVFEKISSMGENIIYNFFIYKKSELFFNDYYDINCRWFKELEIINKVNDMNIQINNDFLNEIVDCYESVESNIKISDFYLYIVEKNKIKNEKKELKYAHNLNDAEKIFYAFKENLFNKNISEWEKIIKDLNLCELPLPTIFEYFVNLSFSLLLNIEPLKFKMEVSRTLLNKNLEPVRFAPGKGSDGIIVLNVENQKSFVALESTTISNVHEITKAEYHIKKHANELAIKNSQKTPMSIFVTSSSKIDDNNEEILKLIDWAIDISPNIKRDENRNEVVYKTLYIPINILYELIKQRNLIEKSENGLSKIPMDTKDFNVKNNEQYDNKLWKKYYEMIFNQK